jgi:hypothetical protein
MGFMLRSVVGAFVIYVSGLRVAVVVTSFGALFREMLRRRREWLLVRDFRMEPRAVTGEYSGEFLEQVTSLAMILTVISHAMYGTSPTNLPVDHSMLVTLPFGSACAGCCGSASSLTVRSSATSTRCSYATCARVPVSGRKIVVQTNSVGSSSSGIRPLRNECVCAAIVAAMIGPR